MNTYRSSPQLGGIVPAASRKIRRRWMKRDRFYPVAVTLQRGDACSSTAIRVQQPQLRGIVIAASRKIRRRWMKRHRGNIVYVSLQRGDACRSTAIRVQQPQPGCTVNAASRKIRRRWMKSDRYDKAAVSLQRGVDFRNKRPQANKVSSRHHAPRMFHITTHVANQLLHKQRAKATSAHHSKPLREKDAVQ